MRSISEFVLLFFVRSMDGGLGNGGTKVMYSESRDYDFFLTLSFVGCFEF